MGNNHLRWFDKSNRKILLLSFEEEYLKKISKCLSNIEIEINDSIGFKNTEIFYKKLNLKIWYLTVNNRHLWKHHFIGSQGLIFIFSFKEKVQDQRIIYEVLNVINDENIAGLPILIVLDTNNKDKEIVENLKTQMKEQIIEEKLKMVKYYDVDFDNDIEQIKEGIDWLCDNMKPLTN